MRTIFDSMLLVNCFLVVCPIVLVLLSEFVICQKLSIQFEDPASCPQDEKGNCNSEKEKTPKMKDKTVLVVSDEQKYLIDQA
jgi:hypothetical protein